MHTFNKINTMAGFLFISQFAISTNMSADTTLHFNKKAEQHSSQSNSIYIKDGKIHFSEAPGKDSEYSIYDSNNNKLIHINPAQRAYIEVDQNTIDQQMSSMKQQMEQMMAQMQEQMKNMPPEQRKMMEQMMAQRGVTPGKMPGMMPQMPKKEQYNTNKTDVIAGVKCNIIEMRIGSQRIEELCIANENQFAIDASDKQTIKQMQIFINKMAQKASSLSGQESATKQFDGVPIRTRQYNEIGKLESETILVSVSNQAISSGMVSIPAGYKKQSMPRAF
ncbi:MAG: hypothetical protein QM479_16765 [Pseudomonadota bacterium]